MVTVTTLVDEAEFSCSNGDCSLRDAIFTASPGDTIDIPAGTYTLTLGSNLQVDKNLTLMGAGASTTIIEANSTAGMATHRVLLVSAGTVVLDGLTLRHGAGEDVGGAILHVATLLTLQDCVVSDNASNNAGGGIFATGALTLTDTTISGNMAGGNDQENVGGGIAMGVEPLSITDSIITGNTVIRGTDMVEPGFGHGGGLNLNGSTATVTTSTITDNMADDDGGGIRVLTGSLTLDRISVTGNAAGRDGGGLMNFAEGSTDVIESTFSGNMAGGNGGGIYNQSDTVNLVNSTLSGNSANDSGGGAYNLDIMNFSNATVSANTADADMDDTGQGGGVHGSPSGGDNTTLQNTVMAANTNPCPSCTQAPDCRTPVNAFTSNGYNVVGDITQCSGFVSPLAGPGDQAGGGLNPVLDAGLEALASNGGPTQTHALAETSIAVDAGDPAGCTDQDAAALTNDQRGFNRPDFTACDSGAYELQTLLFADGFESGNTAAWAIVEN